MSLVVAQVTDEGPRIVSDTRVIFRDGRRPRLRTGVLKTIVVSADCTVSFAGDVYRGLSAVREFARLKGAGHGIERGIRGLRTAAGESAGAVEFIVASADPAAGLVRIRSSGIERDLIATWIGDCTAFEGFQAGRDKPIHPYLAAMLSPAEMVMMTLTGAMSAVIADPALESVGDFCVAAAATGGAFNYLPSMESHVGRDYRVEGGRILLASIRPVEEGGYAFSVVQPVRPGIPAIGVSFPAARLGLLYLPLEFDEAQVIEAVSAREFVTASRARYGVELSTPMLAGPP